MNLNLTSCELSGLLQSVVETFQPKAAAKQQALYSESESAPLMVVADRILTVQGPENLISNAVKYSPRGKAIQVRLKTSARMARCEVQDEGPGLSTEDQKKLFGKFARLSAKPTGGEPSVGIARKLLESMKGRVWCESELGRGATFVIELARG